MKIALIITELHPGGAEKCMVDLAEYLQDRGHQVAAWQLWPEPPRERRHMIRRLEVRNIPWHSGNARYFWEFPGTCRWLRKELSNFAPDVVQSYLFHANVASAIALRHTRIPLLGGARVKQPEIFRQRLQAMAARRMQKLVCVSRGVAEHCRAQEKIDAGKLVVIPNGIELTRLKPLNESDWQSLGLRPGTRLLLFVGRLTDQKGVVPFLSQADAMLEKLLDHDLLFLGDGDQRRQLEVLRARSRYADRIHLLGWREDAMKWMQASTCLILPARYEGMPNAVLEAMASGLPVVCFEVEGVRELLGEGALADMQIVKPHDFVELNRKVVRLANDPGLQERCGHANCSRVEQHFRLEDQLRQYEQLYVEAVQTATCIGAC